MSWHVTRKKMLVVIVLLFLALVVGSLVSCTVTREEAQRIKETSGQVGGMFGLPPYVGESIAGLILMAVANVDGRRRGRKKERACHVPPTPKAGP